MTTCRKYCHYLELCMAGLVSCAGASVASAEAMLDGTLGSGGSFTGDFTIPHTAGKTDGPNLFHSFSVFNIDAGERATFTGPGSIDNVLSRVTGVDPSTFNGPLISEIPSADFYFINPHGVIFGDNASLRVDGSFHVSTAHSLKLGDGGIYFADTAKASTLTSAPPRAFGFLAEPAPIEVGNNTSSVLQVPTGETLSLVGGRIDVGREEQTPGGEGVVSPGFLLAPAGRVNLVSVASEGDVTLDSNDINVDAFEVLGDINITGGSVVDGREVFVRGEESRIDDGFIVPGFFSQHGGEAPFSLADPVAPPNGGEVNIKLSGQLKITGTRAFFGFTPGLSTFAGSSLSSPASTPTDVPDIKIEAGSVVLSEVAVVQSDRFGPGSAAAVEINADALEVRNGASISVNNFFEGSGGSLTVIADRVLLSGEGNPGFTGLAAQSTFHPGFAREGHPDPFNPALTKGDGGSITVNATGPGGVVVRGGAEISTDSFAFGRGGDVIVNTSEAVLSRDGANFGKIATQSVLAGNSGNLGIHATGKVEIRDGFEVSASTAGTGDGGDVKVAASEINISGAGSGIFSTTADPSDEVLNAFANRFGVDFNFLLDLARERGVSDPDFFDVLPVLDDELGLIDVKERTAGNAGSIMIEAGQFVVRDGAEVSARTSNTGTGGDVEVNATEIQLADGGSISAESLSSSSNAGNSGTIDINASTFRIFNDSTVSVETAEADAGNINLDVGFLLHLRDHGSITTSAAVDEEGQGQGDGGDIRIDPVFTVLDGSSKIVANALEGSAGNIRIRTDFLFRSPDSEIKASNRFGVEGNVEIDSPDTDVISGALALPESFLDAASLLSDRCRARAIKGASSFIVSGRGGVPPGPETVLPSQFELGATPEEIRSDDSTSGSLSNTGLALGPIPLGCGAAYYY
ncbi:MAG: filamentous hemagglutinin N-terminal domain-containing protein [Gammaproteobacteria bacterium]